MPQATSLRVRAAFLTFLLVPNLAIPAVDGLVAHRHPGESRPAGPHFESPDFQCGHADHCTLAASLLLSKFTHALPVHQAVGSPPVELPELTPASHHPSALPLGSPQPRAPPASIA